MAYGQVGDELLSQAVFAGGSAEQVEQLQDRAKAAFDTASSAAANTPEAGAISRARTGGHSGGQRRRHGGP